MLLQRGQHLDSVMLSRAIDMLRADESPSRVLSDDILRATKGRSVRPKTAGQKRYIDAIRENVITFGIGPAGTGKSWLAVAMAVQALQTKQVQRIILTRPAVEAGEWVAHQAVQLCGGLGYMTESEVERQYRDMRILGIGGCTTEILTALAAKTLGFQS